jgi:hypothetical protein
MDFGGGDSGSGGARTCGLTPPALRRQHHRAGRGPADDDEHKTIGHLIPQNSTTITIRRRTDIG